MNEHDKARLAGDLEEMSAPDPSAASDAGRRTDLEGDGRGANDPPIRGTTKPTKLYDAASEEARNRDAHEPEPCDPDGGRI